MRLIILSDKVTLVWAIVLIAVFFAIAKILRLDRPEFRIRKIKKTHVSLKKWTAGVAMSINRNKRSILRDVIAVFAVFVISLGMEYVVFQWDSFTREHYHEVMTLEDSRIVKSDKDVTTYAYEINGRYVRYLYIYFEGKSDIEFEIEGEAIDKYDQPQTVSTIDTGSILLGRTAIGLGQNLKTLRIQIPSDRIGDINEIIIANKYVFFNARFLLVFVGLLCTYFLLFYGESLGKRPELLYFVMAVSLGTVLILSAHHSLDSWDEQLHFNNAYVLSNPGSNVAYTDAAMSTIELRVPTGDTVEEEQWIGELLDQKDTWVLRNPKKVYINYTEFAYLPQAFAIALGILLHWKFSTFFFLGKFFNLLFCSIVVALAIHFSKYGKRIIMCIGLVPTVLFQFSCYTYDGFVLAMLLLGLGLFLTEYLSHKRITWGRTFMSILAITVGTFSKAVYIPLLAIYWILPKEKFHSKRQRNLFCVSIAAVILIMLATFVLPILTSTATGAEIAGDYRGGADTSQTGQLGLIFSHPATYTGILLGSIGNTLAKYFIGPNVLTNFAYRGIYDGIGFYIVTLTMLFVYLHDYGLEEEYYPARNRKLTGMKLFQTFLIFGTVCLIWTALYLDFTSVGSFQIMGVSPRYYLPLLLPFSFLFINQRLKVEMTVASYTRMIVLLMYLGSGITIYNLVLK